MKEYGAKVEDPIDADHERLWREEIERRTREIDEGRAKLITGEEVFQKAHSLLEKE